MRTLLWFSVSVWIAPALVPTRAFVVPQTTLRNLDRSTRVETLGADRQRKRLRRLRRPCPSTSWPLFLSSFPPPLVDDEQSEHERAAEKAQRFRAEAERIRREADRMEVTLTLEKIRSLEARLADRRFLERQTPDQREALQNQLERLRHRSSQPPHRALQPSSSPPAISHSEPAKTARASAAARTTVAELSPAPSSAAAPGAHTFPSFSAFDPEDLDLYLPVARNIESRMPHATVEEQLREFQNTPELQQHFAAKLRELLHEPLQELQRLSELKGRYFDSSSDVERRQLQREIHQMEQAVERRGAPFLVIPSDSVFLERLEDLSAEELQDRRAVVEQLPALLQALYKRRCGVPEATLDDEAALELAILLEHYEPQLDMLLDQVRELAPLTEAQRVDARRALDRLPPPVRRHLALEDLQLERYADEDERDPTHARLVRALEQRDDSATDGDDNDDADESWSTLKDLMIDAAAGVSSASMSSSLLSDLNDLDFVDRSRYVDEFYPCVARMERQRPSQRLADDFCSRVLDNSQKRIFMVSSRPERVVGGYYIRGENRIPGDEESGRELVSRIQAALNDNPDLQKELEFFYIPDPAPLSDEKVEMGYSEQPLILLTTKDRETFYDNSSPLIKLPLSVLGVCSIAIFALGASFLQPAAQDRIRDSLNREVGLDLSWLLGNVAAIGGSFLAIVLAHELAHRVVAWSNKFEVGLPSVVPSVQLGITGTITPLQSPPPSVHALFDFAMAGPMAGILSSVGFLAVGLGITASLDVMQSAELPALPMYLLRTSALGGNLIEIFLGKGTLMRELPGDTTLPMHPFAVSGFVGLIVNALALLPLGHTDGGRIALTMFGRRGAYVVSGFTHVLLCLVGLFGFDQAGLLLVYNLYAIIWQRKLETPSRNEVEELDLWRGAFGIGAALLVALALTPML